MTGLAIDLVLFVSDRARLIAMAFTLIGAAHLAMPEPTAIVSMVAKLP